MRILQISVTYQYIFISIYKVEKEIDSMDDKDFEKTMDKWVAHEIGSAPELRPNEKVHRALEEQKKKSLFPVYARRILVGISVLCLLFAIIVLPIIVNLKNRPIISLRAGHKTDEKVIVKNMPIRREGPKKGHRPMRQLMFQYQRADSESIYGVDLRFPMEEKLILDAEDNYRLLAQPNLDQYIYIFQLNASGKMIRLFPNDIYSYQKNPLKSGQTYYIPSEPSWLYVTGKSGEESIHIIVSEKPISELDMLYGQYESARNKKQEIILQLLRLIESQDEAHKWKFVFENNTAK